MARRTPFLDFKEGCRLSPTQTYFTSQPKDRTRSSIRHCVCECICIHVAPRRVFECIKTQRPVTEYPLPSSILQLLFWFDLWDLQLTYTPHSPPSHVHARHEQSNHRWRQHGLSLVVSSWAPKSLGWIPRVCRFLLHRESFNDLIRISQHLVKLNLPKWLFFFGSCMLSLLHRNSISLNGSLCNVVTLPLF